jgi:hypothetical protein
MANDPADREEAVLTAQPGEAMSKGKITAAFQEAAEQLSAALPREQREQLKTLQRAFTEMRQLHSCRVVDERAWHGHHEDGDFDE